MVQLATLITLITGTSVLCVVCEITITGHAKAESSYHSIKVKCYVGHKHNSIFIILLYTCTPYSNILFNLLDQKRVRDENWACDISGSGRGLMIRRYGDGYYGDISEIKDRVQSVGNDAISSTYSTFTSTHLQILVERGERLIKGSVYFWILKNQ